MRYVPTSQAHYVPKVSPASRLALGSFASIGWPAASIQIVSCEAWRSIYMRAHGGSHTAMGLKAFKASCCDSLGRAWRASVPDSPQRLRASQFA